MKPFLPLGLAAALAGLSAATMPVPADARGLGPHPHQHGHRHVRGFVGLSVGFGWPAYWAGSPYAYYPAVPGGYALAVPSATVPVEPPPPPAIAHPRRGQDPQQTEADWRECNRWATTQPDAMADAQAFQRAAAACMDGHGYSVK